MKGVLKYPYYAEDSSFSSLKLVTDIRGNLEYRINCSRIDGHWYVKGKDLQFIEGEWILPESLIFDYELQKKVVKTPNMLNGIVEFNNETPVFGYYTPNPYKNCSVRTYNHGFVNCISVDIIPAKHYTEDVSHGYWHYTHGLDISTIRKIQQKKVALNHANDTYNAEDNPDNFKRAIQMYENSPISIDRDLSLAAKYIKGITFGAELETINGALPPHIQNSYGIIVCRDGSIRDNDGRYPPEYVTVPYSGAKGLQALRNLSKEIAKRSEIDIKCSYHLHIGGIAIDRVFMVSLFKLALKIQNDIFKMFPYYKTDPTGIKQKNYCKKLPNILSTYTISSDFNTYVNNTYIDVFTFLSGGIKSDVEFNRQNRRNPWGEGKWNIKTRYYWLNFINMVFSPRNTVEFRLHTPTLNGHKIINWLFMCNAIVRFAEKYPKRCISAKKVTFEDVLRYYAEISNGAPYATALSENLIAYYQNRCELFAKDYKNGDFISPHDITSDNAFSFNALSIC